MIGFHSSNVRNNNKIFPVDVEVVG